MYFNHNTKDERKWAQRAAIGTGLLLTGTMCMFGCLKVARAGHYLVRTGYFVRGRKGIDVFQRGFVFPLLQTMSCVPVQPVTLNLNLKCLSSQYLPFTLPVKMTLSPILPGEVLEDPNAVAEDMFKDYVQKIFPLTEEEQHRIFEAAIHGALRVEASKLPIDDLNDNRESFQRVVVSQVQLALNQFGVRINTANIAEIQETDRQNGDLGYLQARERKKLTEAIQQSEIDVGEATKLGNIGKKEREAETRQRVAFLESNTKKQENAAKQEIAISEADLVEIESNANRRAEISIIEARSAAAKIQETQQAQIELLRATQQLEAKRALDVVSAKVAAEAVEQVATGAKKAQILETDALVYKIEQEAKARRFAAIEEAIGIREKGEAIAAAEWSLLAARAAGAKQLAEACPLELLVPVMEIQNQIPQKRAEETAKAFVNLNPQIWSLTGDDPSTAVSKMIAGFAPLVDGVKKFCASK